MGGDGRRPRWDGPAIVVEGVHKSFGDVHALRGIDLAVERGKVLGVLGPNGAGKTTAVKILTTLLRPDRGRALVEGRDVARSPAAVREIIGLAGQSTAIQEELTGRENLDIMGRLYHVGSATRRLRAEKLLERFELQDAADRPAKGYSGGMQRRLDLALSLVAHPRVVFLDEPTTGLDPRSRIAMWDVIREMVGRGTTLLLTAWSRWRPTRGSSSSPSTRPTPASGGQSTGSVHSRRSLRMPRATMQRPLSSEDAGSDSEHGNGRGVTRLQQSMEKRELPARSCGPRVSGNRQSCPGSERGTPGPRGPEGSRTSVARPERLNGLSRWTRWLKTVRSHPQGGTQFR